MNGRSTTTMRMRASSVSPTVELWCLVSSRVKTRFLVEDSCTPMRELAPRRPGPVGWGTGFVASVAMGKNADKAVRRGGGKHRLYGQSDRGRDQLGWRRASSNKLAVTTDAQVYALNDRSDLQAQRVQPTHRLRNEIVASMPARKLRSARNVALSPAISSTVMPLALAKTTSPTSSRLISSKLARDENAPSKQTCCGACPYRSMCRSTMAMASVESAGLPFSTWQSVIKPEAPVARQSLWP